MNMKVSLRPSTPVSSACISIGAPTGLGRLCSSEAAAPTEVCPAGRCGAIAATHAASARPSSLGVPSTGTSPLPSASAVGGGGREGRAVGGAAGRWGGGGGAGGGEGNSEHGRTKGERENEKGR